MAIIKGRHQNAKDGDHAPPRAATPRLLRLQEVLEVGLLLLPATPVD